MALIQVDRSKAFQLLVECLHEEICALMADEPSQVFLVFTEGTMEFQGVFTNQVAAVAHCEEHEDWFVAPAVLDQPMPEESVGWDGMFYPNR